MKSPVTLRDRPILMSPAMVLATIREVETPGTGKTQTRRILSPNNTLWNGHPSPSGAL